MRIEIAEDEGVTICFEGTDGEITVGYGHNELVRPDRGPAIYVHADMPDTMGREGVIYEEIYSAGPPAEIAPYPDAPPFAFPALLAAYELKTASTADPGVEYMLGAIARWAESDASQVGATKSELSLLADLINDALKLDEPDLEMAKRRLEKGQEA